MLQLRVGDKNFLLPPEGLSTIMETLKGCEVMDEKHVGTDKGTQGFMNSYVPIVYKPRLQTVLQCQPVDDDLIDTIKLTMKLNDYKPPT
jgi:hypothetical protein